jgi:DNA polymerase-1
MSAPRPTLYILDAYSRIYQVFHAIRTPMSSPSGQPTNAIFGIFRDLLNLYKVRKPDYLAAAFDGGGRVFRSDIYEAYKAQRAAMPEDMRPQIEVIKRLFAAFRVPAILHEGVEADDVIATLARRAVREGMDVVICTSDKDARQLLDEHTRILNLTQNKFLDVEGLKTDWGIRPDQVVDYLALTGDSVDNVPGVPGIGPKTASELIVKFDTLETLLQSVEKVSGAKRQQNLREFADVARRAKSLVQLQEDVPFPIDWNELKLDGYDSQALKALCFECGFHTFLNEIVDEGPPEPASVWDTSAYELIDTPEALAAFVADLETQPKFCDDTETTGVDPLRADLVGLSFSWAEATGAYLPVKGPMFDRVLDREATLAALRPILADPSKEKVGQNLKYDMLVLQRHGAPLAGPFTDTMVLSYLLESGERNHNLDDLSRRLLGHTMIPIDSLIGKGKNQRSMDEVEVAKVTAYAAEDADAAWRLEAILAPKLREEGLWDLYTELERPLIGVLAKMESVGVKVDSARLKALSDEFGGRMQVIETEIYAIAGRAFNIGSAAQLRQILFQELNLPVISKTPGGEPSTAVDVLEELAAQHPLPRLLIQHRQLAKLKSTYLDALPSMVHPADGRVHASFNQVVAATGRLSSSDPNLQNIPVRTEDGRQVRQAFVAGFSGWKLLTADYSQIELRILAHYSKDPTLVEAFAQDLDIHSVVAAQIFNVPESQITAEQRRMAKTVNFGVIYGLSGYGLATRLGISQAEANLFIETYFARYAGVEQFIRHTLQSAQAAGKVETILGRRRAVSGIKNIDRMRTQAERIAVNAVIQGSAADLIKRAMLDVDRRISDAGLEARMLLQIHDELVFEAPDSEIPALAVLVREAMTGALRLDVPLKVDLAVGPNWLDVEEIDS